MLERLYALLFLFKEYVVLALLVVFSLILMALNDNRQVKQLRAIATVSLGIVEEGLSFIPRYLRLAGENETLRRVNVALADEASRLREAKLENVRLRAMVGLKEAARFSLLPSNVVNKNLTLLRNTLTLDVGATDGVREAMPVMIDVGLVGVVIAVSDHYSVVNVLLNTDFRASAKVQRTRVDGILAWDGRTLLLKNVPKTLDVVEGDVIVTSPYSNTYPEGIRVGVVSRVTEQAGSLFRRVEVDPSVDFVRLEEVFIVTGVPDAERIALESQSAEERLP